MFQHSFLLTLFVFIAFFASAQNKYTISGHIKDGANGEELIGATIYVEELKAGTSTNAYGFYSLTIPEGTYVVVYQYVGFDTRRDTLVLNKNLTLNIEMSGESKKIDVVEVTGDRMNKNVEDVNMGVVKLDVATIKKIPAIFGEIDIIKSLVLLPGIVGAGEGVGGFFVRGGGVDQNLILLDEAVVYNASHLLGFFSVFNSDAIKDMEIYKGGIPAAYGGRLSSLLDVRMKDGNMKKFSMSGGIGLISSRLTIEAPIIKDKMSFIVSGRRTYVDLFLKASPNKDIRNNRLYFYDLNAKYNWRINDKNRIYASGYFGRDVFAFGKDFATDWGNSTATLRWNHLFSSKMFANFTFVYSDFNYSLGVPTGDFAFDWDARIRDFSLKADFTNYLNPNNTFKWGVIATHHNFSPGKVVPASETSIFNKIIMPDKNAFEYAAYVSNEQKFGEKITLQYGLRYSIFSQVGSGRVFNYDTNGNVTDTTTYSSLQHIKTYHGPEPRVAFRYGWNKENAIKANYTRTMQYLHLISNATVSSPFDIWIPADNYIKPMKADQVSIGYFRNLKDNMYEISVETYYKYMQDVVDYIDNAELLLKENIETQLLRGDGYSYGIETMVKKQKGRLTGWVSYTYSRTRRKIDGINNGEAYPVPYDRNHNLAVVLTYQISERFSVSANWVYYTGLAVTFPVGKFEYQGVSVPIFSERNGYRLPAYHRLDLSADLQFKKKPNRSFTHGLNFSVYNAYYNKNVFSIVFRPDDNIGGKTAAYKTYLFPIVPSVTYNFNF
ncbi:TonB-dependent receptor [soil metagenome]